MRWEKRAAILLKPKCLIIKFVRDCGTTLINIYYLALLKVHKIEIFFGFDLEISISSLLVVSKY